MREAASFIASQSGNEPGGLLLRGFETLVRAVRAWRNRRNLMVFRDYDDHILADIGITREDVRHALDLPFLSNPAFELQRRAARDSDTRWRSIRR